MLLAAEVTYLSPLIDFSIYDPNTELGGNEFVEVSGSTSGATNKTDDIVNFDATVGVYAPEVHGNDIPAIVSKSGDILYPIDSTFGFTVQDFAGAEDKVLDGVYREGWIGNHYDDEGMPAGLLISDVETDSFKSTLPLGTWAAGLGGNSVKASTEHYVVVAELLGLDGDPRDDIHRRIVDGAIDPTEYTYDEVGAMYAAGEVLSNESTVLNDIFVVYQRDAVTGDVDAAPSYSITFKDDGKLLYRWGTLIKRPNDIRLGVHVPLPAEWTIVDETHPGFVVTQAELRVRHGITNNPNDQLRPEDLENEEATGRLPSYYVAVDDFGSWDGSHQWISGLDDYSGDGTFLPSYLWLAPSGEPVLVPTSDLTAPAGYLGYSTGETLNPEDFVYLVEADNEGNPILDALGNPQLVTGVDDSGTEVEVVALRNKEVITTTDEFGVETTEIVQIGTLFRDTSRSDPTGLSSDISGGFTWQWFTTMDRDPFESNLAADSDELSGPRWRLKSNKFGQDVPGVEIPLIPHSEPPFTSDNIKYEVGTETITTINLLDGAGLLDAGVDLRNSNDWVFRVFDAFGVDTRDPDGDGISVNGLPLTDGFDFAIYIKGDRKPAILYDVQLVVTYELADGVAVYDYGDAPASYEGDGSNPARARMLVDAEGTPTYYLGTTDSVGLDAEIQPISSVDALGDDGTNHDDEDGILLPTFLRPGTDATIQVDAHLKDVSSATYAGTSYLYAWLDTNLDGIFDPTSERVEFNNPASPGSVANYLIVPDGGLSDVSIRVPNDAVVGESYLRFRLSPVAPGGVILPTGELGGPNTNFGEVEDYQIRVTDRFDDVIGRDAFGWWNAGLSDGTMFENSELGNWWDNVVWTGVNVAELNGVGGDDVFGWDPNLKAWMTSASVLRPSTGAFQFVNRMFPVTDGPAASWANVLPVDFDGDGIDEIVSRDDSGNWHLTSYGGTFTGDISGVHWNGVYEHVMVGDFDGDAREDIVGRRSYTDIAGVEKVEWKVIGYLTNDEGLDSFNNDTRETLFANDQTVYSHVLVGDVTGDGRDDIVARVASTGAWDLVESRRSDSGTTQFKTHSWGDAFSAEPILDAMIGDVNGDGVDDVIARDASDNWWVKTIASKGKQSTNFLFGSWTTPGGFVDVMTGDFNGDGLADVTGRDGTSGVWIVGASTGSSLEFQDFGQWNALETWSDVMVGDFDWSGIVEPPTPPVLDEGGPGDGDGEGAVNEGNGGGGTGGQNLPRLTPALADFDGDGATDYVSPLHIFSIDDILGDFDGNSYVDTPSIIDTMGVGDVAPVLSKDGFTLFPIDSEFGFTAIDFVGGEPEVIDGLYTEGWAGNRYDELGNLVGLELSDAETDLFKSGLPLGTWLTGLGGAAVKASTEHYVTMANILGLDASPADDTFIRLDMTYDELTRTFTPQSNHLREYSASELVAAFAAGDVLPNESSVIKDIFLAVDADGGVPIYSVTFKDDGKLLYRWGTAVKRPNDIRMNITLPLPGSWTETGLTYSVTTANLRVNHKITNNPNDQIRPEDLENEIATGRTPSYEVIANPNDALGFLWVAALNDYAGDGTYYPSYFLLDELGGILLPDAGTPASLIIHDLDGNPIGVKNQIEVTLPDGTETLVDGTVFRDTTLVDTIDLSSDLVGGFTNAWYTTMDRDPFEPNLTYTPELFDTVHNGSEAIPVLSQSGSRWRLQTGKFGQDLPGVDIPLIPHSRPPFVQDNIKYEVGADATTIINLLDGAGELDNGVDLRSSKYWVGLVRDGSGNIIDERLAVDEFDQFITRTDANGSTSYLTINGAWLSEGFDFSVYIKGDRKPTSLYDAQLVVEYEVSVKIVEQASGVLAADFGDIPGVTYAWYVDGTLVGTESTFDLATYLASAEDGSYLVTLDVVDSYGTEGHATLTKVVDTVAPQVTDIAYDSDTGQRSVIRTIKVSFDSEVVVQNGAFVVTTKAGVVVPTTVTQLELVDGKTVATLAFSGSSVDTSGSLKDGNYRISVLDSHISDLSGNMLDGDADGDAGGNAVDNFFRLFGDNDGDRDVDAVDFLYFRLTYKKTIGDLGFNSAFDHNNDGRIDSLDYFYFRLQYLKTLLP